MNAHVLCYCECVKKYAHMSELDLSHFANDTGPVTAELSKRKNAGQQILS